MKLNLNKYLTNITGLQFFQIFRTGILLLISIFLAKGHFSTTEIGIWETFLILAGFVTTFWLSGIIQSLLPLYNSSKNFGRSNDRSPILFNTFVLVLFFSALSVIFLIIFRDTISGFIEISDSFRYFQLLFVYILISNPANLIEYIYLLKNKPKRIFLYGTTTFTLQLIFIVVPILMGKGIVWCFWAMIAISAIRFIWLFFLLYKYSTFKISVPFIKEHLSLGTPLILSMLLAGSAQYIDSFIILQKFDAGTFAIFRYGARELPIVVLLANAFDNAMVPEFTSGKSIALVLKTLRRKTRQLIFMLAPLSALLIVFSSWFYPIVFSEEFRESAYVFNIYLLIIISRLVFPQTILVGLKKTRPILVTGVFELAINVALSLIFVQFFGIFGVALATVIAYYIEKAVLIAYCSMKLKIRVNKYIPVSLHLIMMGLMFGTYIITNWGFIVRHINW